MAPAPSLALASPPVALAATAVGLVLLLAGADLTVRTAAEVARARGVSPFFVGVTVVSIGTSVPEMVTSVSGAWIGAGDLVVGNIVGSEVAQITLAIGVVALIAPIRATRRDVLVYGGAVVLAMVVMILTLEDGVVRSEGLLMLLAYAAFVHDLYSNEGGEEIATAVATDVAPARPRSRIVLGLALVAGGGWLAVTGGVAVAAALGVPTYLVGLLTGLGTTLPEIAVAGVAARTGRDGISVGALLGSNVTDPVLSLGLGAIVADVTVTDPAAVGLSAAYALGATLVVLGLLYWRRGIAGREALVPLALYLPTFALL